MPRESPARKPSRTQEKTERRQQQLQQDFCLFTTCLEGEVGRLVVVVVSAGNNNLLLLLSWPFLPRVAVFSPGNWLQ